MLPINSVISLNLGYFINILVIVIIIYILYLEKDCINKSVDHQPPKLIKTQNL